jgi:hypothetical protein
VLVRDTYAERAIQYGEPQTGLRMFIRYSFIVNVQNILQYRKYLFKAPYCVNKRETHPLLY